MKKRIISVALILIIAVMAIEVVSNFRTLDYEKAYEKTEKMDSFEAVMSTIVTITEGSDTKQSVIDQTIKVKNRNKKNMIYSVYAKSTSTDSTTSEVVEDVSEYIYYKDNYYIAMPGVKYKSYCGYDAAKSNINNLVNAVTFPYEKMYNVRKYKEKGKMHYEYDVEYSDVSNHVLSALQSAVSGFEGVNFKVSEVIAEAAVDKKYVTERSLWVVYESDEGIEISLEITVQIKNTKVKLDAPDESKYAAL
ncbi:MAG: hypothetical protein ACI3XA_02435 [Clostridia bacterium]